MKNLTASVVFSVFLFVSAAAGQTTWLDRPFGQNWNSGNGVVPTAPRTTGSSPNSQMCRSTIRAAESVNDRALTRAGWFLYGPVYTYGTISIMTAMASVDGMCRPNEYNGFVFVGNRFAGTLAPVVSGARSDASLSRISMYTPEDLTVEFVRYSSDDALCCPSRTSYVTYEITLGARPLVRAVDVDTRANCDDRGPIQTQDNVVAGSVTYRQRVALPPTAVLTVRLQDVSRADAPAVTIAEQRIETAGRQAPFTFGFVYDRNRIQERNSYVVRAEITDGQRLLFTTDTSYPVITQGNPRNVDLVLVQVGGGRGPNVGSAVIRGTVTYLQRIALPANSEVTVRLAETGGSVVAENTFSTGNRQVPIPFELRYEPRDINRQRNYELQAEIRSDGQLRFRSEAGRAVDLRGQPPANIELMLVAASDEPTAVTGQDLNLSKFGTGSLQIGTRGSELILRGNVVVRPDGTADVTLNRPLGGSTTFSGRLTHFDSGLLRITVTNSGNADASGVIEVRYSGRNLNSLTSNDLVLDSQNVILRF
jgi:uncharacterized lipoprotein YbaY